MFFIFVPPDFKTNQHQSYLNEPTSHSQLLQISVQYGLIDFLSSKAMVLVQKRASSTSIGEREEKKKKCFKFIAIPVYFYYNRNVLQLILHNNKITERKKKTKEKNYFQTPIVAAITCL